MEDRRFVHHNYSSTDDRRSFYRNNPTVKFSKGETIFLQGKVPKCLYSIKGGVVEETNLTSDGAQQSIAFEIIGDIIPLSWAFSKADATLFDYSAFTDCELYVISKKDFLTQLAYNLEFSKKMLSRLVVSLLGAKLKLDALEKPHAFLKLLYTFRYLCLQYGVKVGPDTVMIQVPLTQQDLADTTGLTRETTNLELGNFKKKMIVTNDQRYYTVDFLKLNSVIDDEYKPEPSLSMLPEK